MIVIKRLARAALPILGLAVAFEIGLQAGAYGAPTSVLASHSFSNQTWNDCGPYGCIGWKQFAVTPYTSLPSAHMDNGGTYCGSSLDGSWAQAISYWNAEGTVAAFSFPRSDCTGLSYPTVRLVPEAVSVPGSGWWARVLNYDQDPSTGAFTNCYQTCNRGENSSIGARYGYDLSYVQFNVAYSPSPGWEWVARHEIGHVVGLEDHHLDPTGCNSSYYGLMDDAGCDTMSMTAAEHTGVNYVHDR